MKYYYLRPGSLVTIVKDVPGKSQSYTSDRLEKGKMFGLTQLVEYDDRSRRFVFKVGNMMFYADRDDVEGVN